MHSHTPPDTPLSRSSHSPCSLPAQLTHLQLRGQDSACASCPRGPDRFPFTTLVGQQFRPAVPTVGPTVPGQPCLPGHPAGAPREAGRLPLNLLDPSRQPGPPPPWGPRRNAPRTPSFPGPWLWRGLWGRRWRRGPPHSLDLGAERGVASLTPGPGTRAHSYSRSHTRMHPDMHAHIHLHTHTHTGCTHMNADMHTDTHSLTLTHTYVQACTHMHTDKRTLTFTHTHAHRHARRHAGTCSRTHRHILMHSHACAHRSGMHGQAAHPPGQGSGAGAEAREEQRGRRRSCCRCGK